MTAAGPPCASRADGCVATIGVFDGLHRGHRALIDRARRLAAERGLVSTLVTFDPHPLEALRPQNAPRLLTTVEQRVAMALEAGIDEVVVQRFDRAVARVEAEAWTASVLVGHLRVRAVVVGEDFRFGAGNKGDVRTLAAAGSSYRFDVEAVPLVVSGGQRCSSTWARELREAGRLSEAADLVGYAPPR